MNYFSKGFTLIELMIVIAIIGIISAIALPAYQDYIARTQGIEALRVNTGNQYDLGVYFWQFKEFPPASDPIIQKALTLAGKYFSAGGVTISPASGVITTRFDKGVNAGKTVVLTPYPQTSSGQIIEWRCSGTVGLKRLPSSCQ